MYLYINVKVRREREKKKKKETLYAFYIHYIKGFPSLVIFNTKEGGTSPCSGYCPEVQRTEGRTEGGRAQKRQRCLSGSKTEGDCKAACTHKTRTQILNNKNYMLQSMYMSSILT